MSERRVSLFPGEEGAYAAGVGAGYDAAKERIAELETAARDLLDACEAMKADDAESFACTAWVFDQCGECYACQACIAAGALRSVLAAERAQGGAS